MDALPFNERTAQRLMKISEHPVLTNTTHESHLPTSWTTLYEPSKASPALLEAKKRSFLISFNPGIPFPGSQIKSKSCGNFLSDEISLGFILGPQPGVHPRCAIPRKDSYD
jgi:hypothetical protein